MPKAPILYRELFYDVQRDGTFRDLDWALVDTTLGAMVEPRAFGGIVQATTSVVQTDPYDLVSFNRRTQMKDDLLFSVLGTGGQQFPLDFNTQ